MKDISAENYHSRAGGVYDVTAGKSSQYVRLMHELFHPFPPLDNLYVEIASKYFGLFIDMWRLILKHIILYLQILFLSRYCNLIRSQQCQLPYTSPPLLF